MIPALLAEVPIPTPTPEVLDAVGEAMETVDYTAVLDALQLTNDYLYGLQLTGAVLCGVVLGCAVALILAVMFR